MLRSARVFSVIALLGLALAGCGGGGGGGGGGDDRASFSLSTTTVNFKATSEQPPAAQTITASVTGEANGTLYVIVTPSNPILVTATDVAVTGPTTGTASIIPGSPSILGAGNHTGTISVRACLNDPTCNTNQLRGSPQTVTVNYSIDGVATSVPAASGMHYQITNNRTSGDTTQIFNVTGSPNVSWTAAANQPWLTLSPTSGNTSSSVAITASVSTDYIDRFRSGTYTTNVKLTPSSGVSASFNVTLHLDQAVVNYVGPYLEMASTPGDVIIRGANFANANVTGVSFGGTPASQFTVVNGTQINATHPALPAGKYPITITTNPGGARTYANLKVVQPATYAPVALSYPTVGTPFVNHIIYDAERKAVLVAVSDSSPPHTISDDGRLYRYEFQGSGWSAPQDVTLPLYHAIAMAADGETLIAAYGDPAFDNVVAEWDPQTLLELKKATKPLFNAGSPYYRSALGMAVAGDGSAVVVTGSRSTSGYSPVLAYSAFGPAPLYDMFNSVFTGAQHGVVGGSADGGTVLVCDTADNISGSVVYRYQSTGLGTLVSTGVAALAHAGIVVNRNGSRIIMGRDNETMRVYDASLNVTGTLPGQHYNVAIAPVTPRAYAYDAGNNEVRVFDLTAPVGGVYPELTPISLSANNPGSLAKLVISPDEHTLFIAGQSQLVVVPLLP